MRNNIKVELGHIYPAPTSTQDAEPLTHEDYERDIKAKDAEIERVTTKLSGVIENRDTIIQQLTDEIERLKSERLEIAEKAYLEGAMDRENFHKSGYNALWESSDIRKELTNG